MTRTPLHSARSSAAGHDPLALLLPLLRCPSCRREDAALATRGDALICSHCKTPFPIYKNGAARIPWLFAAPEAVRLEWRARYNGFLHATSSEQARLQQALGAARRSRLATERIMALLHAREAQRKQIVDLLAALKLGAPRTEPGLDRSGALYGKLPKRHGLTSYYDNLFRDWSWENGENESLVESVRHVLEAHSGFKAGKMLTLGAGACRLSYDLHRRYGAELSVAVDLNPLLLFVAGRVVHGEAVTLHEFPIAPLDQRSFAVARTCIAPESLPTNGEFSLVLADALDAPFKAGMFDTLLTPWLIDVVPQNLRDAARAVNRLLKNGGTWVNTGTLAFFHHNEAWCYSQEEALDLVKANGFEIVAFERRPVPYLQSPASAHGRIERTFTFSARKVAACEPPEVTEYLPAWLIEPARPVPDLDELVVAAAHRLLQAQILAAVDGKRSIEDIAQLIAKRYGLQMSEARGAVQRILLEIYEAASNEKPDPAASLQ